MISGAFVIAAKTTAKFAKNELSKFTTLGKEGAKRVSDFKSTDKPFFKTEKKPFGSDGFKKQVENYKKELPEGSNLKIDDISKWRKVSPKKCAELRKEFVHEKAKLIKDWEKVNGKSWPRYKSDVIGKNGTILARKGGLYDAHHKQPLKFGGQNSTENITPLQKLNHFDKKGIHRPNGPLAKIEKILS